MSLAGTILCLGFFFLSVNDKHVLFELVCSPLPSLHLSKFSGKQFKQAKESTNVAAFLKGEVFHFKDVSNQ